MLISAALLLIVQNLCNSDIKSNNSANIRMHLKMCYDPYYFHSFLTRIYKVPLQGDYSEAHVCMQVAYKQQPKVLPKLPINYLKGETGNTNELVFLRHQHTHMIHERN